VVTADIQLEKIDDVSIRQPVVKVSQRSAEDQGKSDLQQPILDRASNAISDNKNSRTRREKGQQQRLRRRADRGKDSKRHAGVCHIRYVEEAVYNRDRLVKGESILNQQLGPAIQRQDRHDQQEVR